MMMLVGKGIGTIKSLQVKIRICRVQANTMVLDNRKVMR